MGCIERMACAPTAAACAATRSGVVSAAARAVAASDRRPTSIVISLVHCDLEISNSANSKFQLPIEYGRLLAVSYAGGQSPLSVFVESSVYDYVGFAYEFQRI